jgi:hypothetical protein
MSLFESTKKRPENLEKLFKALKTIPPSSIEAERAFSTAGIFITKLRNRLSAKTISSCNSFKTKFKKLKPKSGLQSSDFKYMFKINAFYVL